MCGILGTFNLNRKPVHRDLIKSMGDKIAHRGPDCEGLYIKDNIGLAHKRLAILDTSKKGAQPMGSKDGTWIIIFNGCIYNFCELKQDLKTKGHTFFSKTDTEVICQGLSEYGISFFERLNGMFAIGAWNTKQEKLY